MSTSQSFLFHILQIKSAKALKRQFVYTKNFTTIKKGASIELLQSAL